MELDWRPMIVDDAAELTALLNAAEAVDRAGESWSVEDLAEELESELLDLAGCTIAAFDGDRMAGVTMLESPSAVPSPRQVHLFGSVHPGYRGRGLGRRLLDWSLTRAGDYFDADRPLVLRAHLEENNPAKERLFARAGFAEARQFFSMACALPHAIDAPVPEGLRLVGYDERHDEATRRTRNIAFADHWGSPHRDEVQWRQVFTGTRVFRPKLSFLLLDAEDRVASYLICHQFGDDSEGGGQDKVWIPNVGTLPEWRGRGAASALLAATLTAAGEQGLTEVGLSVDTGNATGALGVYQRAGFTVRHRSRAFSLDLP